MTCLIGGLVYLITFIYKKTHPPPPPPPGEVFGVELKDFDNLYDQSVRVGPDGTVQQESGVVLTGDRLSAILPSGISIATIDQLRVASFKGMQYCAWGICISTSSTKLIGAYPIQASVDTKGNTLCGVYDPSLLTAPRVVTVTSIPSDTSVPTVLWVYGVKPKKGSSFRFTTEDVTKPERTIYPWFSPLPNQPGSVQWSYDPSVPSACSKINKSCVYSWGTTINNTTQMFLSMQLTGSTQPFPYLSLSSMPSFGWQLLSNGYLVTPVGFGSVQAVSYPTAFEGYPLAVVTFPSITAIQPQRPMQGSSGIPPTGASTFTLNSSGHIVLSDFPTFGFSYGNIPGVQIPGSYITLTTDQTKWLTFTPVSWSDAINAYN